MSTPVHVLDRAARMPDHTFRYSPDPTGVIDAFGPSADAASTLVVLIHGGFWRARYDRTHLYPLAEALAADGRLVAVPEYRRVGDDGGGWPGTLADVDEAVRAAVGWASADRAAVEVAPAGRASGYRVVVVGHSAGGHLAMLAALDVPGIDHVVSLAGVLDLEEARGLRLSDDAVREFLGEHSEESAASADPMQRAVPSCRVTLIHGASDDQVPPQFSRRYARRDPRIALHLLDGIDHYDVIDPLSRAYRVLAAAIDSGSA